MHGVLSTSREIAVLCCLMSITNWSFLSLSAACRVLFSIVWTVRSESNGSTDMGTARTRLRYDKAWLDALCSAPH